MKNRKKVILYSFLLANIIAVTLVIWLVSNNTFLNILLAMYLIAFTPFIYYAANKKK